MLSCSPCPPALLAAVDDVVNNSLIPSLLGVGVLSGGTERALLSLPARHGGMAIPILAELASSEYSTSAAVTEPLVRLLLTGKYETDPVGNQPLVAEGNFLPHPPVPESVPALPSSVPESVPALPFSVLQSTQPLPVEAADRISAVHPPVMESVSALPSSGTQPAEPFACVNPASSAVRAVRMAARASKAAKNVAAVTAKERLRVDLSPEQRFLLEIAGEKGVSSWLTAYPRWQDGSVMKKSDFRDAVCIRYGRQLLDLPDTCVCDAKLTTSHAFTCPAGGYTIARHNEMRDLLAGLMREAGVVDVETEPKLLPCQAEALPGGRCLNRADGARLDVRARGFWSSQQDAYFDVRVTHPAASVLSRPEALSQLKSHERAKKNQYASRVVHVQRGSFTPLVFSTYGISGPETTIFLKSLASLFVERNPDLSYSVVMSKLRTRISFCLLRWCVTCFRGCRGSYSRNRTFSFLHQCRQLR